MQESLNYGFFFYYHFVVEWLGFILAYTAWSLEISVIQSLVQKQKAVALPEWSFDVVTPSAAEQEQCIEKIPAIVPLAVPKCCSYICMGKNGLQISLPADVNPETLLALVRELC